MDNQSLQLIIAIQRADLDELEASQGLDKAVIQHQRRQLQIDSTFDNVAFESSRRLAVSMVKAIQEDSSLLARTTTLPTIDDATFLRLAALNQPPLPSANPIYSTPDRSQTIIPSSVRASQSILTTVDPQQHEGVPRLLGKRSRAAKTGAESHSRKKLQLHTHNAADDCDSFAARDTTGPSDDVLNPIISKSTSTAEEPVPPKAECVSCACEDVDHLIKASCEHYYCRGCFESFIDATLETPDGFPPCCCKVPFAFNIVAGNVSSTVFHRYQSRQEEIRNATALYCGVLGCGVRINSDKIDGLHATCVACMRRTCTQCRGEMPLKLKLTHICKKDPAREAVITLAKQEGWQACYKCGTMISLNFGCHHMTCHCKAELCYKCGTPWKTCDCGDYDEPRILERATRAVGIRAARRVSQNLPPDPRPREQQLVDLRQKLQGNCDHNSFSRRAHTRERPGRCDICEYEGWEFILPCENCPFTSCRKCHNYHGWTGGRPWGFRYDFGDLWDQLDVDSNEASSEEQTEDLEVRGVGAVEYRSYYGPASGEGELFENRKATM